jgi:AbrB family transcriptional regulator, transcriptional pleiotropic regulator of transition state genes
MPGPPKEPFDSHGARGVARRIDDLGRVVIPSEFRKAFGIAAGEVVDMTIEGDAIVVRRIATGCVLCGSDTEPLRAWHGRALCNSCVTGIKAMA